MTGVYTAIAVVGVSMVQQNRQAKKAEGAARRQNQLQEQANQAQGRIAELDARTQRVEQIRQARAAQASLLSQGASQGFGSGTSGVTQGAGQVATQAASNIGTIGQVQDFAAQAANFSQLAANENLNIMRAQRRGQTWQQIGSIATGAFGQLGGWQELAKAAKGTSGGNAPVGG